MKKGKKMNVAMIADNLDLNGISTVIVNYSNELSKHGYNVIIFAGDKIDESFEDKDSYSFSIVKLPKRKKHPLKYYLFLIKTLRQKNIDIAHIHGNSATIVPELLICKLNRIRNRVVHSHNTTCNHILMHRLLKPVINNLCTSRFACSNLAGKWMFGNKDFIVIPNGFNTSKFKYNEIYRMKIRNELKIDDSNYVIGHVGKFNLQKNHEFIIKVFNSIHQKAPSTRLLLIGTGETFEKIKALVKYFKLEDVVIFIGETSDVNKYYSAMDSFIFPSLFEGLGIVAIEAQISGLKCYVSNRVPTDIVVGENVKFIALDKGVDFWSEEILNNIKYSNRLQFLNNYNLINKYDINLCSEILIKEYKKMF